MRIDRSSSGRQYGSGDGYSLEFFGRDSISFVIKNGQIVDGSSVWRSFTEVKECKVRCNFGAGELERERSEGMSERKWCGMRTR